MKGISPETDKLVGDLLEGLFEANIVPNVARNIGQRDPEAALTYLLGVYDALNTLLVTVASGHTPPTKFIPVNFYVNQLRGTAEKIRKVREAIKKEVRIQLDIHHVATCVSCGQGVIEDNLVRTGRGPMHEDCAERAGFPVDHGDSIYPR